MHKNAITVSYVVTVYNKEPYIGYTIDSLLKQEGNIPSEYIFIDDVSKDRSIEVIEERTKGVPDVTIVRNTRNAGPSVRLNEGARLARGRYLQFIDADDIMAANASSVMLTHMEKHRADVVYGGSERTDQECAALVGRRMPDHPECRVSYNPMEMLFEERLIRMSQMVKRETYLSSGGSDERIFIQDESLALRLLRVSKGLVFLRAPVFFTAELVGGISRNRAQLNHDRFLAGYGMLRDFPELDDTARRKLYRRCLSDTWKQQRLMHGTLKAAMRPIFPRYLRSKWGLPPVDMQALQDMKMFFSTLPNIRRMQHASE